MPRKLSKYKRTVQPPQCIARTHEWFLEQCRKYRSDFEDYEYLERYRNYSTCIKTKHLPCGTIFQLKPSKFLGRGDSCPHCANIARSKAHTKSDQYYIDAFNKELHWRREQGYPEEQCNYTLLGINRYIDEGGKNRVTYNVHCPNCNNDFSIENYAFAGPPMSRQHQGCRCLNKGHKKTDDEWREIFEDHNDGSYIYKGCKTIIDSGGKQRTYFKYWCKRCKLEYEILSDTWIKDIKCVCQNKYRKDKGPEFWAMMFYKVYSDEHYELLNSKTCGRYDKNDPINGRYRCYTELEVRCKHCGKIKSYSIENILLPYIYNATGVIDLDKLSSNKRELCKCFGGRPKEYLTWGESRIQDYLIANNLIFESQQSFEDLRNPATNCRLRYDFGVYDSNGCLRYLIEYDGEQHDHPVEFFGGQKTYEETIYWDGVKNDYAKRNNIPLIRIPYTDYDNIENILQAKIKIEGK